MQIDSKLSPIFMLVPGLFKPTPKVYTGCIINIDLQTPTWMCACLCVFGYDIPGEIHPELHPPAVQFQRPLVPKTITSNKDVTCKKLIQKQNPNKIIGN